jgi:hypothetical protein
VGQVTAVGQGHTENGVAGLAKGEINCGVGLRAAVGLNVCVLGTEELAGALACYIFGDINAMATAVVALCGVTLGVLVGHNATCGKHNVLRNEVLGCDKLDSSVLALALGLYGGGNLRIGFCDLFGDLVYHFLTPLSLLYQIKKIHIYFITKCKKMQYKLQK